MIVVLLKGGTGQKYPKMHNTAKSKDCQKRKQKITKVELHGIKTSSGIRQKGYFSHQIFQEKNISYPLIRTYVCVLGGKYLFFEKH